MQSNRTSSTPTGGSRQAHDSPVVPCPVQGPPPEEKEKKPEEKEVEVVITLFFDGTNNNKLNVEARLAYANELKESGGAMSKEAKAFESHGEAEDSSYHDYFTNVVQLERHYKEKVSKNFGIYLEGIGTQDLGSDATAGQGLGAGSTGILAKVDKGFAEAELRLNVAVDAEPEAKKFCVIFNTFGFSRGAAAARNFVHQLGTRRKHFESVFEARGKNLSGLKVHFVGLFDTVASHGFSHSNDVSDLSLDAIKAAKKVVQLAAADEHRKNFALTTIESAGAKGLQLFLPGVHCDIGGGYNNVVAENRVVFMSIFEKKRSEEIDALFNAGWINDKVKEIEKGVQDVTLKRTVRNDYARIPLLIMRREAEKAESSIGFLSKIVIDNSVEHDPLLQQIKTELDTYCAKGNASKVGDWHRKPTPPALRQLRHKYLHFSAYFERFTIKGIVGVNDPHYENDQRERIYFKG